MLTLHTTHRDQRSGRPRVGCRRGSARFCTVNPDLVGPLAACTVPPGETAHVKLVLVAQHAYGPELSACKDRFLVQVWEAGQGVRLGLGTAAACCVA